MTIIDLRKMIPLSEWMKCEICGYWCAGLPEFASHVAQVHKISVFTYWEKYGHHAERGDENINPSKREQSHEKEVH